MRRITKNGTFACLTGIGLSRLLGGWFLLIFSLVGASASAQALLTSPDYYSLPIYPGVANTLAGVLGDLRNNHFHGGIDIRTRTTQGLPVTAAADGYVERIGVRTGGYGKVIYLKHPNGTTTVYGHLRNFTDSLAKYVLSEQYRQKSFRVELRPEPDRFVFRKNELIGLSGNSGNSMGPHLHFEIRDADGNYLNPLFFHFPEITDRRTPEFLNVALRPLDIGARVDGVFERKSYEILMRTDGQYAINDTLSAQGLLGLELQAFDRMDSTTFSYGLYCIDITVDGLEKFVYRMGAFPISGTLEYNNLIDFGANLQERGRFYRCYVPAGNKLDIYRADSLGGRIRIQDTLLHKIDVNVFDAFQNKSSLTFYIKNKASDNTKRLGNSATTRFETQRENEVLKIKAIGFRSSNPRAFIFSSGKGTRLEPAYFANGDPVFLINLKMGAPDSIRAGGRTYRPNFAGILTPFANKRLKYQGVRIEADSSALYDSLNLHVLRKGNTLKLGDYDVPLRFPLRIAFRPKLKASKRMKTHMYYTDTKKPQFSGGVWKRDSLIFRASLLGTYEAMADMAPPKVRLLRSDADGILVRAEDDLSGVRGVSAQANGRWLLMHFDPKSGLAWSENEFEEQPLAGIVRLRVSDYAGNNTILRLQIEPFSKKILGDGSKAKSILFKEVD